MIIYLDQNKWIELARVNYGIEKNERLDALLRVILDKVKTHDIYLPLSAIHYLETARISDKNRRARLGNLMWKISQGKTLASYKKIVLNESEYALSNFFPKVKTKKLNIIGFGVAHAFGETIGNKLPDLIELEFEKSSLSGRSFLAGDCPPYYEKKFAMNFQSHLEKLKSIKENISPSKWLDSLHGIALSDILEPFANVMKKNKIDPSQIGKLERENLLNLIRQMPSRVMEIHLSYQVLRNTQYKPKITDLADWAGLGIASQYCDVVVCEKHFADMVLRDGFKPKAKILKNISDLENCLSE